MAITRLNNNSISSVTALPTAISTGSVLQVKQTYVNTISSQSSPATTWTPITGLEVSITPSSASNKILIFVEWCGEHSEANPHNTTFGLKRDSTDIGLPASFGNRQPGIAPINTSLDGNADSTPENATYNFLDSPNTTSAITYKPQLIANHNITSCINRSTAQENQTYASPPQSGIILQEIKG